MAKWGYFTPISGDITLLTTGLFQGPDCAVDSLPIQTQSQQWSRQLSTAHDNENPMTARSLYRCTGLFPEREDEWLKHYLHWFIYDPSWVVYLTGVTNRRWDRMPPSNQGVLGAIFLRELCHIYARCCYSDPRGCKKRPKRLLLRPEPGSVLDGCENPNPAISYLLLPFKILENHQVSWHIMPDDWWILMTLIANCAGWMMCWFLYVKGDIKWPVLPPKTTVQTVCFRCLLFHFLHGLPCLIRRARGPGRRFGVSERRWGNLKMMMAMFCHKNRPVLKV